MPYRDTGTGLGENYAGNVRESEIFVASDLEWKLKDGSGSISTSELLNVMRAMGENPTEDDVLNLMMEADLDGSGTIEFPEFLELMKHKYGNLDIEDDIRYATCFD